MTTTSILSHLAGELSGQDLQTISDFALDAPWEWRQALESLIDAARRADDLEDAEAEVEDLRAEIETLEEVVEASAKAIHSALDIYQTTLPPPASPADLFSVLKLEIEGHLRDIAEAFPEPLPEPEVRKTETVTEEADQTLPASDRLAALLNKRRSAPK